MALTLNTLPKKFHPFLLSHPSCPSLDIKRDLDLLFQVRGAFNAITEIKNAVYDVGMWILKDYRTDVVTAPDTYIYRVRKAEKIRTYIQQKHLENEVVVPKKYLYWIPTIQRFTVVSEKLSLSKEVLAVSPEVEQHLLPFADQIKQVSALKLGNPRRELTVKQVEALADLALLGCTDFSYKNFFFTEAGQLALIDTEPTRRALKKNFFKNRFNYLFSDKSSLLAKQAICELAKIKYLCVTEASKNIVKKIEKKHVLLSFAKIAIKANLISLAGYGAIKILPSLPIGDVAKQVSHYAIGIIVSIKCGIYKSDMETIYNLWTHSCNEDKGLMAIHQYEQSGH